MKNLELLKNFKGGKIEFVEKYFVKDGIECFVYKFLNFPEKDLAIVSVKNGEKTPKQKVLKGEKTIEGIFSGVGIFTKNDEIFENKIGEFFEVELEIGDLMIYENKFLFF